VKNKIIAEENLLPLLAPRLYSFPATTKSVALLLFFNPVSYILLAATAVEILKRITLVNNCQERRH